jgi:cell division protein FtsN
MERKQRFFIYDGKEMGVLLLLGVMVAVFAFTLGVHLGKRVGPKGALSPVAGDAELVATSSDKNPNRQELNEQSKGAQQAADESLNQALHEEVARTGIKLDTPRQVQLPEKPHSENAGATTTAATEHGHPRIQLAPQGAEKGADHVAAERSAPPGHYTLQIGSYPVADEARDQADSLEALGLRPYMRPADVRGSRWYRVYVGGFESKEVAEKAGARYVSQHMIEAYVVSKRVD